jgi:alanyl-tRNA synthetase
MTQRLYYDDSYLREFRAKALKASHTERGYEIILDQTAFYPSSGGQPHDLGHIHSGLVKDVFENEHGEIIHCVDRPVDSQDLECSINWERRFDHMQQHTGQHVLSQAFLRTSKLDTVSFHMGVDYATIDLDAESASMEQVRQAEDLANSILYENRPIKIRMAAPEEVPELGLRKESHRSGPLRIVEVKDFDVSACGGTHVKSTGEVGVITIRKIERVNRQARVEFACGRRALELHRKDVQNLEAIARRFSVGLHETHQRVEKQGEEVRQLRRLLQEKNKTLARLLAREFYVEAPEYQGFKMVKRLFEGEEIDFIKLLAQCVVAQGPCVALLGNRSAQAQLVLAQSESLPWDLRPLISECSRLIEGRGGGSRTLAQAGGRNPSQLQSALDWAEAQVLSKMKRLHPSIN